MNNPDYFNDHARYAQYKYRSDPALSPSGILVAIFLGVLVLYKILDTLGFPVFFWLYTRLQMAQDMIPIMALKRLSGASSPDLAGGSELFDHGEQMSKQTHGSNVLQTVFGLNSQSFINGVKGMTSSFAKTPSNVPPGLGNWDNSCYQNSIIQVWVA